MKDEILSPGTIRNEAKQFTASMIKVSNENFKQTSDKVIYKFNKPWWNDECSRLVTFRRMKRRMEATNSRRNILAFRRAEAKAKKEILAAKRGSLRKYISKINDDTPLKEIWEILSKFKGKYRQNTLPIKYDGEYHYSKEQRALALGKHYQKVMSKERNREYLEEDLNRIEQAIIEDNDRNYNKRFSMRELITALNDLPSEKAYGKDEVHNLFLKNSPKSKIMDLLGIFNRSWNERDVSDEWKTAVIIPIPKPEKNLELPSSFRPISLLSCVSKTLENMVAKRLAHVLETNNSFSNNQYGFRYRRGTIDPIIGLEHEIHKGINNSKVTLVVFFDIKSAYDTVDHILLLNMLAKKGIEGNMLGWIKDFLSGRNIQVSVEDILSEELAINNGLPQGSGISTLLFDIIISNIPNLAPVKSKEFADDVAFSVTTKNLEWAMLLMQDAIERFVEYIKSVGLTISSEKTKAMCFTLKRDRDPLLKLEDTEIEVVEEFKYLGMYFDAPRLTWKKHIQYARSRCQQGLNVMKAVSATKWGADRQSLLMINQALVRSRATYGSPALVSMSKTNYRKMETIQNEGLRVASGCLRSTYIPALQAETNIIPLELYIKKQAVKYYYKLKSKNEEHSIKKIIYKEPEENENRIYNENAVRNPFILKTQEILREWRLPVNPNIGTQRYPSIAPWEEFDNVNTELIEPVTKTMSVELLKQVTLETIERRYKNFLRIYTDGSKKEQPLSTTAAFCIPTRRQKTSWKLHPNISIEGAEISAIEKATEFLINSIERPKNAVILTDSKVGLYLIKQRYPKNYEFGVSTIQRNIKTLQSRNWSIILQWIPSHCGVEGNEEADLLANQAHNLGNIDEYPTELKEMDVQIEKAAQRQWKLRWDVNKRECALGDRKLHLADWNHCRHKDRRLDVSMTRLRVEVCRLNYHMHKMGLSESPLCRKCDLNTEETVTHFLIECTSLAEQRNKLKRELNKIGIVRLTTDLLLGNSNETDEVKKKITQEFGKFLQNSERLDDI